MEYVVDVQGFKTTLNEFIFKEVAIMVVEKDATPSVFLFKPPYEWTNLLEKNQSENRWLERHFHGILWSSGDIPYEEVGRTLRTILENAKKIYVKGLEKRKWLARILPNKLLQNIEDLGCPSLSQLCVNINTFCTHHSLCWNPVCAVKNAHVVKEWLLHNRRKPILITNGFDEVDYPNLPSPPELIIDENILHSMYT